jgi:hypothetical protein
VTDTAAPDAPAKLALVSSDSEFETFKDGVRVGHNREAWETYYREAAVNRATKAGIQQAVAQAAQEQFQSVIDQTWAIAAEQITYYREGAISLSAYCALLLDENENLRRENQKLRRATPYSLQAIRQRVRG